MSSQPMSVVAVVFSVLALKSAVNRTPSRIAVEIGSPVQACISRLHPKA